MPAISGPTALLLTLLLALPAAAEPVTVGIGYLALAPKRVVSQVTLDPPPADEGVQGARVALADDQTTARTIQNQRFEKDRKSMTSNKICVQSTSIAGCVPVSSGQRSGAAGRCPALRSNALRATRRLWPPCPAL